MRYVRKRDGKLAEFDSECIRLNGFGYGLPSELIPRLVAVAFAIRDMGEGITSSLFFDLAILNPEIRKFLYDLTTFPEEDGLYAQLNPGSAVLFRSLKYLENKVFKCDKESLTKREIKKFLIHEDKREIYKLLALNTYNETRNLIKSLKGTFGYTWKDAVRQKDKEIAYNGQVIYESRESSKAVKFINSILGKMEGLNLYTGVFSEIAKEVIRYIEYGNLIKRAEKPSYIYYWDKPLEEFVEEKFRNKDFSVINITGQCRGVVKVPSIVKDKVDLKLYLSYKSYRVRTHLDGYIDSVDPENLKNHSLQVIGIPSQDNGEAIIFALHLTDKGECYAW